jgi:hypothetical protein
MELLAAEDADSLGWKGMEVYQDEEPRTSSAATSAWLDAPTRRGVWPLGKRYRAGFFTRWIVTKGF